MTLSADGSPWSLVCQQLHQLAALSDRELAKIDAQLEPLANGVGFPIDQFKFVICLLISFPLVIVHRFVPTVFLRHVYSFVLGLAFGWLLYGKDLLHPFLSATMIYLLVRFVRSSAVPTLAFVLSMGYLSINHIYRQYYDYLGWKLDYTASQMIVTLKVIAFAFDTYDARKKNASIQFPSFLEFYSYIFYFANFLAGPFFEYEEYKAFIDRSLFKKTNGRVPFSFKALLHSFIGIGISLFGSVYVRAKFPSSFMLTDEFYNFSVIQKILYTYISFFGVRANYYSAWTISHAIAIVSGFSYRELPDGRVDWDRMKNVDVIKWETSQNLHSMIANWNIRVAGWLKKYIYERLAGNNKPGAREQYATFAVSAFWHGFYPGYYMFFIVWPFFTNVAGAFRKTVRTLFLHKDGKENYPLKYIYDFASLLATIICGNYLAYSFHFLAFDRSVHIYKQYYFAIHLMILVLFIVAQLNLLPRKKIDLPPQQRPQPAKKTE